MLGISNYVYRYWIIRHLEALLPEDAINFNWWDYSIIIERAEF